MVLSEQNGQSEILDFITFDGVTREFSIITTDTEMKGKSYDIDVTYIYRQTQPTTADVTEAGSFSVSIADPC